MAIFENWCNIIVEGDKKIFFELLFKEEEPIDWSISSIIYNTFDLSVSFVSCELCCVKRFLNSAAHSATKYVVALKNSFLL